MKPGSICWFEVMGKDGQSLRSFYNGLFGWEFQPIEGMDYGMAAPEGVPGGVGATPDGSAGWATFYVEVADLEASVASAQQNGGRILMPVTEVQGGRIVVIADPEGHPIGLHQGR